MGTATGELRVALDRIAKPPVDILLDPSLLVAANTLEQLPDSRLLEAQTQATLGHTPTKPRVGTLYVPSSFHELIKEEKQLDVQKTKVWDFFRGQADGAYREHIIELLDAHDVEPFDESPAQGLQPNWQHAFADMKRHERLTNILAEELAFLNSGSVLLSRTPASVKALRDAGVPTLSIGKAELKPQLQEQLTDLGYSDPAGICAMGFGGLDSLTDALIGNVIEAPTDVLLYYISC